MKLFLFKFYFKIPAKLSLNYYVLLVPLSSKLKCLYQKLNGHFRKLEMIIIIIIIIIIIVIIKSLSETLQWPTCSFLNWLVRTGSYIVWKDKSPKAIVTLFKFRLLD